MKGRHSEVNDINGTVVTEAQRLGRFGDWRSLKWRLRSKAGG
jgi:hypothetical protein